ncbi:LysR family transcriptional regulator substrate-binding protein [Flavonifractor plautii]|nr:LysR family transcriptional regulator substrate-binding protein [Flavonifractor plautii]
MNDQVDLGVVIEPYENPHMRLKTVYRSDVVLAVARNHRLAERTEVEIAELRDEPMLMVSKDYMFHDQVLAHCLSRRGLRQISRLPHPSGTFCWK